MSISSSDSIFAIKTEKYAVPAGATLAQYVDGEAVAGCNNMWVQHLAGGTLFIMSDGSGSTLSAAALAAQSSSGSLYIPPLTPFQIMGPASMYLVAAGATATVNVMYGKTQA